MASVMSSKTSTNSDTSSSKSLFPLRSSVGSNGRLCGVFANHFPMKYTSDLLVHHYDIDMEPMRLTEDFASLAVTEFGSEEKFAKKRFRKLDKIYRIVVEEAVKANSGPGQLFDGVLPVYDGQKNMYTTVDLNLKDFSGNGATGGDEGRQTMARIHVEVNDGDRMVTYALNIKKASVIEMNHLKRYFEAKSENISVPSEAIQVLNILLRHGPTLLKIPIGNSLYYPYNEAKDRKDIGGGRMLAFGYFQSVRPDFNGVSLVIDRTATALYDSGFLPKFMAKVLNKSRDDFMALKGFTDYQRKQLENVLKGNLIQVKHLTYKRKYKVIGLTKEAAKDVRFEVKKTDPRGKEVSLGEKSVVEFFEDCYPDKCPLKFADLPCVKVGSMRNPNFLPLDVCELVPDQHVRNNLTADQMVEMIRSSAAQMPEQRLNFIKESAKNTLIDSKAYMKEFGVSFVAGNTPLSIDARVLNPPSLKYGQNRDLTPNGGKWEIRNELFYTAARLNHWVIVRFSDRNDSKMDDLERNIRQMGSKLGMDISAATKKVCVRDYGIDKVSDCFKRAQMVTNNQLQLIFFIISPNQKELYERIKKVGDVDFSIATQCIKESNLDKLRPPLVQNIMLKINTKLGGINAVMNDIEILRRRTMIVGVDSSHPGVGDRQTSSVSACVASFDDSYVRYFATTRKQRNVTEISKELQEMMVDLLREYQNRNKGMLPEQIIIYRDGVSEGQFNAALQKEIKGLVEAFRKQRDNYEPNLTYIVVQKRHHTRFFPKNPNEGVGRARNVPPGLVVDTDVVSKTYFDYFLCSHEGIQGTSRPSHYFVLWDDNNLTADQLQQLTFSLTHIYARCTRSISYPAPVAYAHLAAYRAQRHTIGARNGGDSDSGSSVGYNAPRRHRDETQDLLEVKPEYKSKMYFC